MNIRKNSIKKISTFLFMFALVAGMLYGSLGTVYAEAIAGDGYSFEPDTGCLTVSSLDGCTNWSDDPRINGDNSRSAVTSVVLTPDVYEIGADAFSSCTSLATVTIPDSVEYIGAFAFSSCTSLATVTIPDSVEYIGAFAFSGTALTTVTIPNSVTRMGSNVFEECSFLTEVTLSDNLGSIMGSTFKKCSSLETITIPSSISSIAANAFQDCSSLTKVTIPNSVTGIGNSAFMRCTALEEVTIPNSVTIIEDCAFLSCTSLATVTIPDSVSSMGISVFENCSSLTAVTLSGTLDGSISQNAFLSCTSLAEIIIPDGISRISANAFKNCSSLTEVVIPDSIADIAATAFTGCTALRKVSVPNGTITVQTNLVDGTASLSLQPTNIDTVTISVDSTPAQEFYGWIGVDTGITSPKAKSTTYQIPAGAGDVVLTADFIGLAGGSPVLTAGAVTRTSDTTATVKFTSNTAGQYYYTVVTGGAINAAIDTSSTGIDCGTSVVTITLSDLMAGANDIYIVVKSTDGAVSDRSFKITIPAYTPSSNTGKKHTSVSTTTPTITYTPTTKASDNGSWVMSGNRWWYKNSDNTYPTGGWQQLNGQWYSFDKDGYARSEWYYDENYQSWFYLDTTSVEMKTGWFFDAAYQSWFYLNPLKSVATDGAMKTGWFFDAAWQKWYYFYPLGSAETDGSMAVNTRTPDGYYVGADGSWIQE